MRRRLLTAIAATIAAALLSASAAEAAAPTLGPLGASDIQGVSALLLGSVDPEGLPSTYLFEYSTQASFSGAVKTASSPAGSGSEPHPARAAIAGLSPDTTYHYRLLATNSSGTTASAPAAFTTTHGFGFLPGEAGFAVHAYADGGAPATKIGSHPYQLGFEIGLNTGGEFEGQPGAIFPDGDLRDLAVSMPAGLILNPAVADKCSAADFHTPRTSPFESSRSGESCPPKSQLGTIEIQTSLGGGQTRRFGLFNLDPAPGLAAQLGAAPFGSPLTFDAQINRNPDGSYALGLSARNFPQALDLHSLEVVLWGTPWAASHNGERGNCLNEAEAAFPWSKCSVGEPLSNPPAAFLTLPSQCSGALALAASADSWQQPAPRAAVAVNRDSGGAPAALSDCAALPFNPKPVAQLTSTKASSASGFAFDLTNDNTALLDPGARAPSQAQKAVVALPAGVSINPSVGAGLGACTPAQYEAESAFSAEGSGCPNDAKIGSFEVRTPLFGGLLDGSIYLARPDDPASAAPGAENPFDSLVAVYLVARLPARGALVKLAGKLVPDPTSGDLVATFDALPQLPYTDLTMTFRAGQRALLVTPPACGTAATRSELFPWAQTAPIATLSGSPISSGINSGPCPAGPPPFAPGVLAGAVNSNVNSYTPYFVHIARTDTEAELTSYSLKLPKGITGKLAGIPFCPEAAIAAARARRGFAEAAAASCPAASEVGHTLSGYGVGNALTYATGRIYLAGPYHGQPLSLVAVNPATV
ncbi:MAG TPA: hypothetical protein VGR07_14070, partial [Thermoanaerobaculia bacterium]|nr:hypothetical protein [Thermoanaerobaculia bacterium]